MESSGAKGVSRCAQACYATAQLSFIDLVVEPADHLLIAFQRLLCISQLPLQILALTLPAYKGTAMSLTSESCALMVSGIG